MRKEAVILGINGAKNKPTSSPKYRSRPPPRLACRKRRSLMAAAQVGSRSLRGAASAFCSILVP